MGREIRRVPLGWEHPKDDDGDFLPCHDHDFRSAMTKWFEDWKAWDAGTHPDRKDRNYDFWEWESIPDPETSRPVFDSDPTCYQIYETVTEGTPVSPVFESLVILVQWLVDQGYSQAAAEGFAREGWAPSMAMVDGKMYQDIESAAVMKDKD